MFLIYSSQNKRRMNSIVVIRLSLLVFVVVFSTAPVCSKENTEAYLLWDPQHPNIKTLLVVKRYENDDGHVVSNQCEVIQGNGPIRNFPRIPPVAVVEKTPDADELSELIDECNGYHPERRRQQAAQKPIEEDHRLSSPTIILPGTKWCGAGDIAKNEQDLGILEKADACCRTHDHCNDTMAPGETKHNLTNTSHFTALNCECDDKLYDCLEDVNSFTSNAIGKVYFNTLRRQCYALDYPQTETCETYRSFLRLGCVEYQQDENAEKVWQWFPAKKY